MNADVERSSNCFAPVLRGRTCRVGTRAGSLGKSPPRPSMYVHGHKYIHATRVVVMSIQVGFQSPAVRA